MEQCEKRRRAFFIAVLAVVCVIGAAVCLWLGSFYRADEAAMSVLDAPSPGVTVERRDDRIVFRPEHCEAGLIFYPGGRVQFEAYAPLMDALAARGVLCVLLRMPGNLAVLRPDAADGVREAFPEIGRWFIAGHSLGGAVASICADKHPGDYEGLILLAAYPDRDLRESGLRVLSVTGTEDGVLNRGKYEAGKVLLPDDAQELVIEGGCHSYFGSYGMQKEDGKPAVSREAQTARTAEEIAGLIRGAAQAPAA